MKNIKNWWYYHKWYVICGLIVFGILVDLVGNALGIWKKKPDFEIAYVGKAALPEDTVSALEEAFASIAEDFNRDGRVTVQVNQYTSTDSSEAEAAYFQMASQVTLMADITACQSYFFLTDDPESLQKEHLILAAPDGSCPSEADYSTEGKAVPWTDCPVLMDMDLGTYSVYELGETTSGENQELLSELYIGRRCFRTDKQTKYAEQCSELWKLITKDN